MIMSYGNIINGTISSVSGITTADTWKFYKENYIPNGSAISIVGDFNSKEMKAAVTKLFSGWKQGKQANACNCIQTNRRTSRQPCTC